MELNSSTEPEFLSPHRRSRHKYHDQLLALDQGKLFSLIFRYTNESRAVADDLLQEVYERLLRLDSDRAAKIQSIQRYAFGIIRHVVQDWRQRRRNSRVDYFGHLEDLATIDHQRDVEEIVSAQQEFTLLYGEIERLPARRRNILVLIKVYGYSAKEVAKELGIAESTVKKQLQIAALRCHDALTSADERPGLLLLSKALGRRRARV